MATMLLSLTSLYPNADLDKHPRICIIFNNVSKSTPSKKMIHLYGGDEHKDESDESSEEKEQIDMKITPPSW